jgi:hypothetical protein
MALDPATETGYCAAPFSNLTSTAHTEIGFLKPLVNPKEVVPSASDLAKYVEVVLYSHLHSDHFNAALLIKMMRANPTMRVVWPAGSLNALRFRPKRPKGVSGRILEAATKVLITKDYVSGIHEYLHADAPPEIPAENLVELTNGASCILRENPIIEIRSFEVRHPRAQFYIRLPFEPVELPPVLGYEISYDEGGTRKTVLLVGESGTDPELLWQIWTNRKHLTAVFVPVADEPTTRGLKWLKDAYHHASLQIIALSERLSGSKTTIHCLHQGLWYYTLDYPRVEAGRKIIEAQNEESPASLEEVSGRLVESRRLRGFSLKAILAQVSLIKTIGRFSLTSFDKVRLHPIGQTFCYSNEHC